MHCRSQLCRIDDRSGPSGREASASTACTFPPSTIQARAFEHPDCFHCVWRVSASSFCCLSLRSGTPARCITYLIALFRRAGRDMCPTLVGARMPPGPAHRRHLKGCISWFVARGASGNGWVAHTAPCPRSGGISKGCFAVRGALGRRALAG